MANEMERYRRLTFNTWTRRLWDSQCGMATRADPLANLDPLRYNKRRIRIAQLSSGRTETASHSIGGDRRVVEMVDVRFLSVRAIRLWFPLAT